MFLSSAFINDILSSNKFFAFFSLSDLEFIVHIGSPDSILLSNWGIFETKSNLFKSTLILKEIFENKFSKNLVSIKIFSLKDKFFSRIEFICAAI